MTITLLGIEWELRFTRLRGRNDGYCHPPHNDDANRRILIHDRLKPKRELEVTIHEMLHAIDWHKDEAWVKQSGKDIAEAMWRLGYRRVKELSE